MARKRKGKQLKNNNEGNKKPKMGLQTRRNNGHKKNQKPATNDGIDVIINGTKATKKLSTRIILQCLATHVARAVSLGSPEIYGNDGEEIAYFQDENGPIATVELFDQRTKHDKEIVGSMNILSTTNGHYVLDPLQVTTLLNAYTRENRFVLDYPNKKSVSSLLFVFGEQGQQELMTRRRNVMVESILNVGRNLLSLVKENDNSIPLKTWKRRMRFAVNDMGIAFEMKPQDAAEAAGIRWNPRHKIFSM